ncbi:MAG: rhamnan synthesis F family protein [Candidatus Omnitrophota bacterium]
MKQNFKIGVVAHFFYTEQAEVIARFLKNIPFEFGLYASVPQKTHRKIQTLLTGAFPGKQITLKIVENRGFDIAPFVCEFKDYYAKYDLVLKIHTKKSSHAKGLKSWQDYLFENLIGSTEIVQSIIKMFHDDEKLGIVYPETISPLKKILLGNPWQENWRVCRDLGSRFGLSIQRNQQLNFPAGSMFWFRPSSLEPLFKLGFSVNDFPGGRRIRRNNTLAHAIERFFVLIAQKQGFSAREVSFVPYEGAYKSSFYQKIKAKPQELSGILMDFFGVIR